MRGYQLLGNLEMLVVEVAVVEEVLPGAVHAQPKKSSVHIHPFEVSTPLQEFYKLRTAECLPHPG
jgi:hypothetical protein